jgi:hypothetical protein
MTRPLETVLTLVLEHCDAELSQAHRELYPERVDEHIPFSLTLLYPWLPPDEVSAAELERVRAYFAGLQPLEFELVRVTEFPGEVAYAEPKPDEQLRATMRGLWALYPKWPPYRRPGFDPPPHATLARYAGPGEVTFEQAKARVDPLLPVRCTVGEVTLLEEYEPDRVRVRTTFPLGA